jgi:hypothetical protein
MPRMKVRYVDPQPIAQTVFNYPSTWKLDCKELYVDPQPIAQTVFNYPSTWKLDCKELAAGEIVEEKEKIRTRIIREESLKVAAYLAVSFVHLQHNDVLDSILKDCSLYLCSMQSNLYVYSMIKIMQQPLDSHRRRYRVEHGMGL